MLLDTVSGFKKTRNSAETRSISRPRLETLQDLLDAIRPGKPEEANLIRMLSATAGHISMTLGQPSSKISIRQLLEIRPRLRLRLREKGFKRNSHRSYSNFVRILLAKARELGWWFRFADGSAGPDHARQNGQRLDRPVTAALHTEQAHNLHHACIGKSEIARRLKIGRTSVRRILAK